MKKKIIAILMIITLSMTLVGCESTQKEPDTTQTLEEILEENNYTIVDVRTSKNTKKDM